MPSRRAVLAGAGTVATYGIAGCVDEGPAADVSPGEDTDTEWPQLGGNDRYDCYVEDAAAPREEPGERWTADIQLPMARPVVADGRVLLFTYGAVAAYDLGSGDEVWRFDAYEDEEKPDPRTPPLVVDGTAYLGVSNPDGVLAVDVRDGERQFHADLENAPTVAPVVGYDREVLVVGTDTGLAGLTVGGELLWRRGTFSPVSALTSWGDGLYAGTDGGELLAYYGLEELHGQWRRQLDGAVVQIAQLDGDGVVVSVFGGDLSRRDGSVAGDARWSHDSAGAQGFVAAQNTYGVTNGLTSVHTRTGERHWTVDEDLNAPPAGAGDTIYSGGEGFVAAYAMDGGTGVGDYRTGYERWRYDVDGNVHEGVAVADGALFAIAHDKEDGGTLYALE